ncbi:fibropellin-1-like [Ptychodera flava]|uniref:fibropellin-1-like n=1 Tax=Ptychodera flava TaxID=63121 RepID=UPI00396A3A46
MCVNKIFENPGYECDCLPGFVGDDCQYVIDNCLPTNPCQNEGSCTNMIGDYLCDCQPGYGEKNCDTQIDFCLSNPCQHGGTCHTEFNSYTCICPDPERQTGINCEILDLCIGNQCQNGATCIPGTASYTCNCPQGYTGLHCDILIDYCQPDPCYNDGICENSLSGFTCHCQDSYTGDYCQTLFSPCHLAVTPCLNGGTCKTDYNLADKYWCECRDARFHPPNCDLVNPCSESPCQNDGICVISENANQGYLCACQPNFYGASCETYIEPTQPPVIEDICIFKPCKNDGICIAIAGQDYDCDCSNVPFFGIICHLYTRSHQYDGRLKITNKEFNDGLIADEDFKKSFGKAMSNVFVRSERQSYC